jgi:hypothetical protein
LGKDWLVIIVRDDTNFELPFEDNAKTLFDIKLAELKQKYNCNIHFKPDVLVRDISKTYNPKTAYDGFYNRIVKAIDSLPTYMSEFTVKDMTINDKDYTESITHLLDPWIHYNDLGTENSYPINIHLHEKRTMVHPGNTRMMLASNFDKFADTTVDLVICDYTNQYEHNIQLENFPHGICLTDFNNSSKNQIFQLQFFAPRSTFNKQFYNSYNNYLKFSYNEGILKCNDTHILTLDTENQKVIYFDNQDTSQIIDRNWQILTK